ncbi:hypothetical protein EI74_0798 [Mycoplasma testudineum]|uniref:Uncharacterized protein n=2 Tax=Mycoplasma testudineum TaxID=244584 RepID=A0A4R6I9X8_9MOLU|nr:hypothetical protein EI74_0798 [Mycoplasma testudineum]
MAVAAIVTPGVLAIKINEEKDVDEINELLKITSPFSEEQYNNLSILAQKNVEISNWIKSINFDTQSMKTIKNKLYNLNVSLDLKKFMNRNLDEKFELLVSTILKREKHSKKNEIEINKSFAQVFDRYIKDSNGNIIEIDGKNVLLSGDSYTNWDIHDYFFADDESWFRKSNEDVYQDVEMVFLYKMAESLKKYNASIERHNGIVEVLSLAATKLGSSFSAFSYIPNLSTASSIYLNAGSTTMSAVSALNSAYHESRRAKNEFEKLSKISGIENKKLIRFMNSADLEINQFSKAINNALRVGSFATSAASSVFGLVKTPKTKLISLALNVASLTFDLINALLNIKTPNGFSIIENMHDHGLNDFRNQWINNTENMVLIQKNWSENFKYGIQWKVSDGWFTLPRLFIRAQKHGENDVELFGFNWDQKVKERKK